MIPYQTAHMRSHFNHACDILIVELVLEELMQLIDKINNGISPILIQIPESVQP